MHRCEIRERSGGGGGSTRDSIPNVKWLYSVILEKNVTKIYTLSLMLNNKPVGNQEVGVWIGQCSMGPQAEAAHQK